MKHTATHPLTLTLATIAALTATIHSGICWMTINYATFAFLTIILTATDIHHQRLPNPITIPAALTYPITIPIATYLDTATTPWTTWTCTLIYPTIFITLALIKPGQIGLGDIKLAPTLGTFIGTTQNLTNLTTALALTLLIALIPAITTAIKHKTTTATTPFAPPLLLATWITTTHGTTITTWYQHTYL